MLIFNKYTQIYTVNVLFSVVWNIFAEPISTMFQARVVFAATLLSCSASKSYICDTTSITQL